MPIAMTADLMSQLVCQLDEMWMPLSNPSHKEHRCANIAPRQNVENALHILIHARWHGLPHLPCHHTGNRLRVEKIFYFNGQRVQHDYLDSQTLVLVRSAQ